MAAYRDRVYGARVIVRGFYGNLLGQGSWCKGNCKESVWQLTESELVARE